MPETRDDIEFHLLAVTVEKAPGGSKVSEVLKPVMRTGDTLFTYEGNSYIAAVGTRPAAMKVARRITTIAQEQGLTLKIEMFEEPFPFPFRQALERVVGGWVKVYPRRERDEWHG